MGRKLMKYLLEQEWTEDVDGREEPVPKPRIIQAEEVKRVDLSEGDVIYVKDGGITSKEAAGLGWNEEKQIDLVTLDIRTIDAHGGRERLEGVRDETTLEAEKYGGLVGEVERIVDEHRKDLAEYQLVEAYEINDISQEQGFGRYRVDFELRLHTGPVNVGTLRLDDDA